ncbi:MAG: hypothetical protein AAGK25_11020 [Pseudomonadota bacterium]
MYQLMKDVPDWIMGTAIAGAAWFGVSYGVLAPRAMERDKVQEIIPECALELDQKQNIHVADALAKAKEAARYAKEETARKLRLRKNALEAKLAEAEAFAQVNRINQQSGLSDLMGALRMPMAFPSFDVDEIRSELGSVRHQLRNLRLPETISIPKAPRLELVQSCVCAAGEAIAGKRTAYTISMASFKTITPDKLLTVKTDLNTAFDTNICNAKPWENYS